MRSVFQASPWIAANTFNARPFRLAAHTPPRLGAPSAFFAPAPFMPRPVMARCRRVEEEIGRSETTHEACACEFLNLGQGCSKPTGGGSGGSAEYTPGAGAGAGGDGTIATVVIAGGLGLGALYLLGVL